MTPRQVRVLELVADGCANKEIAARLGISEPGVRKHLERLFRRYRVTNRAALVHAAVQWGDLTIAPRGSSKRTREH
ncbi:MAG: response regulator transcription factor [Thermoleophilaceae bacterium]